MGQKLAKIPRCCFAAFAWTKPAEWSKEKDNDLALNDLEREFLNASLAWRARETAEKKPNKNESLKQPKNWPVQKSSAPKNRPCMPESYAPGYLPKRRIGACAVLLIAAGFLDRRLN